MNTKTISAAPAETQQDYQGGAGDPQAAAQGNQGENGERRGSHNLMNFVKSLIKVLDVVTPPPKVVTRPSKPGLEVSSQTTHTVSITTLQVDIHKKLVSPCT